MSGKPEKAGDHQEPSSSSHPPAEDTKKWGTHVMGPPSLPSAHPDNQQAASWNAGNHQQVLHQPYVQFDPVDRHASSSPLESVIDLFNSWNRKAETIASNIWHNRHSVSGAAWGKVNLTAKAITGGGFEPLFRQIFSVGPNERLQKSFACYLSTTTGPVAGTFYLSTARVAFCSDRPLSFTAPSGQLTWSYYKVSIPLVNVAAVNPLVMKENPPEKYIQIVTTDGHDFWFMGFVSFEKASHHLLESVFNRRATQPVAA